MKIDLGSKPYPENPMGLGSSGKAKHVPYYPSAEIEDEDIPADLIGQDIKCEVTVRITRAELIQEDGTKKKKRFRMEFRKVDFGNKLKDQSVQDDITDAIEGINETQAQEAAED